MVYLDTSALVALIVGETHSAAVARWYAGSRAELVSAACCVPEFASALGIKRRTGQLDEEQALQAWQRFGRLAANDLKRLPVDPAHFHRAAVMVLDTGGAMRAGDAGAKSVVTLDDRMARNAQRLKIKAVAFA